MKFSRYGKRDHDISYLFTIQPPASVFHTSVQVNLNIFKTTCDQNYILQLF